MTKEVALQKVAEYCKRMGKNPPANPYAVFAKQGEAITLGYDTWAVFPDGPAQHNPEMAVFNPSYYYVNCETGEVGYFHG